MSNIHPRSIVSPGFLNDPFLSYSPKNTFTEIRSQPPFYSGTNCFPIEHLKDTALLLLN